MEPSSCGHRRDDEAIYHRLAGVLRVGVAASLVCVACGLVLSLPVGRAGAATFPDLGGLLPGLARLDPGSLILLGIAILLTLPAVQAVLAAVGFGRRGDRRFTLVSLSVLAVQVAALIVAWLR